MPIATNTGTRDIPLKFAAEFTEHVNQAWSSGEFWTKTTPITQDLLRFWFGESFTDVRYLNFHSGQKQAILNTIYAHEILKSESTFDLYSSISPELLAQLDLVYVRKDKFSHPKYCMKMATGTGKTWVLQVLMIWQYLNAKHEENRSGLFSNQFLLVAPGLIVYERLLDAFLGKTDESGMRKFETSDISVYKELFLPPSYRNEIFRFVQNSLVRKEEIGKKITGDGLIAITNWHLLAGEKEEDDLIETALDQPEVVVKELLPITPGKSQGHTLETLDNQYLSGGEIEYLANLDHIVVFNDEAHHIHENKTAGIVSEVEWQKSLNKLAENKGKNFIQIDFSATPYDVTGSGQKRTHHYFPHIIVDFKLEEAIRKGLVKTITLDKRKEIAALELDFRAIRDDKNKPVMLSDGQKLMLRAGLKKLQILEEQFVGFMKDKKGVSDKHPKMLVVCEDTLVSPLVVEFLQTEGLKENEVTQIDSDRKGSIPKAEWEEVKQKLFNIDKHESPKVIVSVLMLREGFDVNNICVIVPLRSSQAPILLEQILGRGLRLMWRSPEFMDLKDENRKRILEEKKEPANYLDILSIVEHPAFIEFYNDLNVLGLLGEDTTGPKGGGQDLGDLINVELKSNYKAYDLYWPIIIQDKEETLKDLEMDYSAFKQVDWYTLYQLKKLVPKNGETFYSEEMMVKTRFGEYKVTADLFSAQSYNEFLSKMINVISTTIGKVSQRKSSQFPVMQINQVSLVKTLDHFIRFRLFSVPFNPFEDENWRVLLLSKTGITNHIVTEMSRIIYEMQRNIDVTEAMVIKRYFSETDNLKMRERFSVPVSKCIYSRLAFPSNKGGLEKKFIEFCDRDSQTESFIKINDHYHHFAHINYIRTDGILSFYFPDFMVKTKESIYLVETKAQSQIHDENVRQKQFGALDWIKKINELSDEARDFRTWEYVLLGENTFYGLSDNGGSITDVLEYAKLTRAKVAGTLF